MSQIEGAGTNSGAGSLARSSSIMAAGTMVSRILGMARIVVLAWAFGTGTVADIFSTANTLPNNFFILIGGGVLNAVLVPQITAALRHADGGKEFVDRLVTIALVVLGVATVLLTLAAGPIVTLYRQPCSGVEARLGLLFAAWCLPQIFFYGLYTVWGQILNARGSFGPFMWAPVANNVISLLGMVLFIALLGGHRTELLWWSDLRVSIFGALTTAGVIVQALVLWPVLRKVGFRWTPRWGLRGVGLRSAGRTAGWTFAAVALGQLGFILTSRVTNGGGSAQCLAQGAVTGGVEQPGRYVFDTAFLLFMLPHSLIAVSVVTAAFTPMAKAAVAGDTASVQAAMVSALRLTGLATVAATVAFVVLGPDLSRLVYLSNPPEAALPLYRVTLGLVVALVPFSAQYLFQRVFYAYQDAKTPFMITVWTTVVAACGTLAAGLWVPIEWRTVAVTLSMSAATLLGAGLSWYRLRARLPAVNLLGLLGAHGRFFVASLPAGALAVLVAERIHSLWGHSTGAAAATVVLGGLVFLTAYIAGLSILRVDEVRGIRALLVRR